MQADTNDYEVLERVFMMPNLLGYWNEIQQRYKIMGFTDQLTDEQKIAEYDFITKQLNKYISSHKNQIMKSGDLEKMLAEVEALHSKATNTAKERKQLVYVAMRDDWLLGMYQLLDNMIHEHEGAKEEEERDGWTD